MKRKKLLIFGIFLSFFISCSDELERIPPTTGEVEFKDFGIRDARYYFEENATDLAPLRFTDRVATKSSALPAVELIPEWDKAIESGHSGVRLVEVPLQSNTFSLYVESVIKSGKLLYQKRAFTRRRLVIARRSSGETDMFVITLVPSSDARGNIGKSLENFRYLGGGDFTGRVFCSTLEGEFVKAFGYTDGRLSGRLLVMKRSELAKHAGEGLYDHYSTIRLAEGMKTRSGTYLFDEGGGAGSGYCPHGYPEGQCPHYGCNDEVVVVACPDCGTINGCFCPRCFSCGEKEKYCSCARCPWCQRKVWECTCYEYPDPDPDPNPGGGGGGSGGGETSPDTGEGTILPDIDLTNQDHFVGYNVSGDCMAGCRSIMANYGVATGSSANVYQLLFERNGKLEYYNTQDYETVYDNAINCINRHLDANRPIIVGVNHTLNKGYNEGTTDHWIVITGREYDTSQKQYYYTYMDTGRSAASNGCNTTNNRLYYDSKNYVFQDAKAGTNDNKKYDVTQVRPNDGKNLSETISQPTKP